MGIPDNLEISKEPSNLFESIYNLLHQKHYKKGVIITTKAGAEHRAFNAANEILELMFAAYAAEVAKESPDDT
jgi:hypothetical protein